MPRAAKGSPEAKAWAAKMKAARAAKSPTAKENKNDAPKETYSEAATFTPSQDTIDLPKGNADGSPSVTIGQQEYADLLKSIEELKKGPFEMMARMMASQNGAAATISGGKLTGTVDRFPLGKELYPSPIDRLAEEPKLQRFAFKINYELNYEISESAYTTIDNVRMREPKFKLELIRVMMDEDTGDPTTGRYVVCQLIMHEDPDTAMIIAREQGLPVDESNEALFLNEMRYIRMRDWLLECFYPSKPETKRNRRDMVIDGRLVSYFEVNSEQDSAARPKKADWDNLPRIKF